MIGVTAATGAAVFLGTGHVRDMIAATVALGVLAGSQGGLWLSRPSQRNGGQENFCRGHGPDRLGDVQEIPCILKTSGGKKAVSPARPCAEASG